MENIKGTSIVDTKEYLELLKFQEAMEKNFVKFEYNDNIWFYAYSKDDLLEECKAWVEKEKKEHENYIEFLNQQLDRLEKNAIDAKTQLEKASKFSLSSFLIGFKFCVLIFALLYFFIEISK